MVQLSKHGVMSIFQNPKDISPHPSQKFKRICIFCWDHLFPLAVGAPRITSPLYALPSPPPPKHHIILYIILTYLLYTLPATPRGLSEGCLRQIFPRRFGSIPRSVALHSPASIPFVVPQCFALALPIRPPPVLHCFRG